MFNPCTRRTFLQGAGVSMALPWLESLPVWGEASISRDNNSEAPIRFGVLFSGSGVHRGQWWATGSGREMELGRALDPLHDFREKLLFVRGLYNAESLKGNIHSSQTGNLLSGAPLASGGEIRSGTSIDQVLANSYGQDTKVSNLVLGCEKSNPGVHKNYSMLYSSHISWTSATTPTPLELYPALAFDRLFKDTASRGEKSVLDSVGESARSLRLRVSGRDLQRLDEYFSSVREVERRIERAGNRGELQGWRPTITQPDMARPEEGLPQDIAEHMRLMCDIMVLGFQTDATRVSTLKLCNDHSYMRFPQFDNDGRGHHELSHSDRGTEVSEAWLNVNRLCTSQLAYIARKLDAIQEGERTALDNSILLFCSSMMTGSHDSSQLPLVIVGRGGGKLETGRILDYREKSNRKMCSLYLSLMDKYGVRHDQFGDSRQRLEEI
ncbi:MAG: DUF1552 domain-containing protein [Planctomycetes bacterium]|nr:DUF1552 domain-containing protein [Planctomycetota bacterium]